MPENELSNIFLLFYRIYTVTLLFPLVVALLQRKYLNKSLKYFVVYKILNLFFNILEQVFIWAVNTWRDFFVPILNRFGIGDTSFLAIFYYLNDFIFIVLFYRYLSNNKNYIKSSYYISIFLLTMILINYFFIEGYRTFGIFNPTVDSIFVFSIASFYLLHLYRSHLMLPLQKNPYFWISLGLIVPQVISFFLFLVGDIFHKEDYALFLVMSIIKNCFLILAQVLFAVGFWRARYAQYLPLPGEEEVGASTENV